jgi:hypothetical protein
MIIQEIEATVRSIREHFLVVTRLVCMLATSVGEVSHLRYSCLQCSQQLLRTTSIHVAYVGQICC